jgi:hypothetical protein
LPAVRLLGRKREREQQEGQRVRRRSRDGRSGKEMPVSLGVGDAETAESQPQGPFLPCVTQERVREEENEEKGRQRLASREVARAKNGSASNRRARKCVDAAARVGPARRCRYRWGLGTPRQR